MAIAAGALDRRIRVEQTTPQRDKAGDEIHGIWGPPNGWPRQGHRWAGKSDRGIPRETPGSQADQQTVRWVDTIFTVRYDRFTSTIAPETFRIIYRGAVYLIIGLSEGERADTLALMCSSRPDQRGALAPDRTTGNRNA